MFIFHDDNELDKIFGVKSIETRGDRSGKIFKFEDIYLKVYDHPKKESTYIVQIFYYGDDVPIFIDEVPYNKMKPYVESFK